MGQPILHILTVGTSAFGKSSQGLKHDLHPHNDIVNIGNRGQVSRDAKTWAGDDEEPKNARALGEIAEELCVLLNRLQPACEVSSEPPGGTDFLPAELSSLQVFYTHDPYRINAHPSVCCDQVLLLCSQTQGGYAAGKLIELYININNEREDNYQASFDGWICRAEMKVVTGLTSTDAAAFREKGLTKLVETVHQEISNWREAHPKGRVVINPTGGYKGSIPHLVLMAAVYDNIEVIYKYEDALEPVLLPAMPLALDLPTYRDYRWLLRAMPQLTDQAATVLLDEPGIPAAIRSLFTPDSDSGKPQPNFLYKLCANRYEKEGADDLSPHGSGELLLDLIKDQNLLKWLRAHVRHWQNAWLGDQVPEMAEHQRGHSQRVLELASQIIRPALKADDKFMSDWELAVFIAAVWLHDVGHAGRQFTYNEKSYVVDGFPTLVRDFHHFLAAQMLSDDIQALKDSRSGAFFRNDSSPTWVPQFIEAVRLVALHHRKRLPLDGTPVAQDDAFPGGDKPSGSAPCTICVSGQPIRWKLLTALYRVVDAADVQRERVGLREYQIARADFEQRQTDRFIKEAKYLLANPPCNLKSWAEEMAALCDLLNTQIKAVREQPKCENKWTVLGNTDTQLAQKVFALCGERAGGTSDPHYAYKARILSLLSSAAFKQRQPDHWRKHAGVEAVIFSHQYESSLHTIIPFLWVKRDPPEVALGLEVEPDPQKRAQKCLDDIGSELNNTVRELFEQAKVMVVTNNLVQVAEQDDSVCFCTGQHS
jgi:hypothetical protein